MAIGFGLGHSLGWERAQSDKEVSYANRICSQPWRSTASSNVEALPAG
jgi:hypothetical protein